MLQARGVDPEARQPRAVVMQEREPAASRIAASSDASGSGSLAATLTRQRRRTGPCATRCRISRFSSLISTMLLKGRSPLAKCTGSPWYSASRVRPSQAR